MVELGTHGKYTVRQFFHLALSNANFIFGVFETFF